MTLRRATIIYGAVTLIASFFMVYYFNQRPAFFDAYYHYNAAVELVEGNGFVDNYIWTYVVPIDAIPAPSHLYWLPGTTLISALGMLIFGANYAAAQLGLALCLWGAALMTYWIGWRLGGSERHAWQAGLIVLFAGFTMRYWGQTDTFAPYAFFGGMTLVFIGLGISSEKRNLRWWILAGVFAAASHLIRNDGLIMILVGWSVLFFPFDFLQTQGRQVIPRRILWMLVFTLSYLVAMSPWMIRNLNTVGSVMASGGTRAAWFTEYNDLFSYPPDASPEILFADGTDLFIESRMAAIFGVDGAIRHFIGEQGIIILTPFIFIGLWMRRHDLFIRPVWIFAVGIHLAFTIVFPFPGMNGGLWHASAALMPFWAVLGLIGIDGTINWIARHRRTWNSRTAKPIFSTFAVLVIVILSLQVALPQRSLGNGIPSMYRTLAEEIPPEAKVMINAPPILYYYTCAAGHCLSGVVLPNETPEVALEIAERYDVDYLVIEPRGTTAPMQFDVVPDFLTPVDVDLGGASLYAFERD